MAFLHRLHPHLETTLQRLSAMQRHACSRRSRHDAGLKHVTIRGLLGEKCGVRGRSRLVALMMPRLLCD